MKKVFLFFLISYGILALGFFLFSYTQVDLSLTLSRASLIRDIESIFQYVGFYNRPLATGIYLFLLFGSVSLYTAMIVAAKKKMISEREIWKLILVITGILFFSYPAAFSYDIFNYVFTAKTIVVYGNNPYAFSPILFEQIDPMLSFMRWTHLPSAYTPLSIAVTLVPYILSFGHLLFSVWLIRGVFILFYLLTAVFIAAISRRENRYSVSVALVLFAFNPLVIVEVLISGHNDSMMMAFAMFSMLLALQKQRFSSFFVWSLSVATKLMTVFLFPLAFIGWNKKKALLCMSIGLGLVLLRREFLPWYFLWIIPFIALFPESYALLSVSSGITLGLLLRYAPVLYTGGYDNPVSAIQSFVLIISIAMGLFIGLILQKKYSTSKR